VGRGLCRIWKKEREIMRQQMTSTLCLK
jgi:hypothetical protein